MTGWTPSSYSYTVGLPPQPSHRVSTSPTELRHLGIAFIVLTFDLAILFLRIHPPPPAGFTLPYVSGLVLFGGATALTGFVVHEMAHKVAAQRAGFWAEFRMSPMGLVLSILTAAIGFLFASPGATVIGGMGDVREWGRTSLAGPGVNLIEGGIFFAAAWVFTSVSVHGLDSALWGLAFFNGWFSTFNLIPFGPLDGRKVLRWNTAIWAAVFVVSAAFSVVAYLYWTALP
jgi:Zn-dependent protease